MKVMSLGWLYFTRFRVSSRPFHENRARTQKPRWVRPRISAAVWKKLFRMDVFELEVRANEAFLRFAHSLQRRLHPVVYDFYSN